MSDSLPSRSTSPSQPSLREWGIAALLSLGVSLAVIAPFFHLGTASGHDVSFHMASWLDAAGQWKQGVLLPRWAEWANFGFGEPRFIFYPPLSWLFGAFLGSFIPWPSVDLVFIVCVQTFAGLSAYTLLRRLLDFGSGTRFGIEFSPLFGAACFAANPYALLIIYIRSDFAELLAMAFFPLLLLATLRLGGVIPDEERGRFRKIFLFAILFCTVWLSNAPAAVIGTYSVVLLFALCALSQRTVLPLATGCAGIGLGFALASFYLIPAAYEQRWVNIAGALSGGLTPRENFLYAKTADAEHDAFNRIASNIAVLLVLWLLLAAVVAWRRYFAHASHRGSQFFLAAGVLGAAAILLMLPVTITLWRYLPELQFVQFPWRWMSMLALCAIIFTAATAHGWLRWAWLLAATFAVVVTAQDLVKHAWWDTEDMPALEAAIQDGIGFEGTDEYDPIGDDRTDLPAKQPRASWLPRSDSDVHKEARIVVKNWTAEHRVVRVVTNQPGRLVLRLLNYPAWRVTLNGAQVSLEHPRGTEQMIIPVPAGDSELRIDFTRTMDRTLGGTISLASLAASVAILVWQRRAAKAGA
jgi:6-pyruvoyl-tetrahydropterin synthase related domain